MKILYLIDVFNTGEIGGAEIFGFKLLNSFDKRKDFIVENLIIDSKLIKFIFKNAFVSKVFRKIILDYYNPFVKNKLIKNIISRKPDVIHIHCFNGIGYYILQDLKKIAPVIMTVHNNQFINYAKILPRFLNKIHVNIVRKNVKGIQLIAPSKFIYNGLISEGFENVIKLPNGIVIPSRKTTYRNNILYVGRISEEKGLQTIANELNYINGYKVFILGDGPLKNKLESQYKNLKFVGFRDPDGYYKNASILVYPSICTENQPLAVLEAMSYGLVVIASKTGGIPEILHHKINGILFTKNSIESFKTEIKNFLCDYKGLKKIGKNARKHVMKSYNWNKMINRYLKIYKNARRTQK